MKSTTLRKRTIKRLPKRQQLILMKNIIVKSLKDGKGIMTESEVGFLGEQLAKIFKGLREHYPFATRDELINM